MEQIIKTVTKGGNGAIVYVPSKWINKQVNITLIDINIEEEIFNLLKPNLKHVIGIYLYGSYARNEQLKDSDIDILVIVNEKFELSPSNFDVHLIDINTLKKGIKKNPIIFYSIIKESKPIINQYLLEELKINNKDLDFSWFIETTKSALEIDKKFLELKNSVNGSVIYSIILRARGLYLMKCILSNKDYTNKDFLDFLVNLIYEREFVDKLYNIYRQEKINKSTVFVDISFDKVYKLCLKLEKILMLYEKRKKS